MPKTEYIDRESAIEAAIDAADEWEGGYNPNRAAQIREGINYLPAADVKPVNRGEWVGYPECLKYVNAYADDHIVCSVCEECFSVIDNDTERFNFCPHCGADMTGGGHAEV